MTNWIVLGRDVMRQARNTRGLSYEAVGRALSVSSKTYERWEGKGRVPRADLERVAEVIGLQVETPVFLSEPIAVVVPPDEATPQGSPRQEQLDRMEAQIAEILRRLAAQEDSGA